MSEETRAALDAAERAFEAAQQAEQIQGRALIESVLQRLPAIVEALARKATKQEPDRVRELGREGIDRMRAELAEAVSAVSEGVRRKSSTPWRIRGTTMSRGATHSGVSASLDGLFTASEVSVLGRPVIDAGFRRNPQPFRSYELVYEEDHRELIGVAVERVQATDAAYAKLEAAKAANDRDDVADAWGD